MTYDKRPEGRKFDELRPIVAKAGVIPNAEGSAYFKIGKTVAYAAVYGPRELHPKFLQNPEKGVLRCLYNMMPFAGMGDRVRPGPNRRAKEISLVTEKAILPFINLDRYPNAVVDVFIELTQTDAGSRCAGICAAAIALADAGIEMREMISAVAVGKVADKIVVDLDYSEEIYEDGHVADIPIAMGNVSQQITLLQADGYITREDLKKCLEIAKKACAQINEIQKKALKQKYEGSK
ncbi:exosome complex exonuclease Rrp41 [Candidatus Woesearchaeota archaeon]|nr:MAG: exosome complex exonuclease Rrp41 [Candidatus Woesearchaeota archaeon]